MSRSCESGVLHESLCELNVLIGCEVGLIVELRLFANSKSCESNLMVEDVDDQTWTMSIIEHSISELVSFGMDTSWN